MYRQLLSLLFITTFLISCGGGNAAPDPEITGIQPDSGPVGTAVTIAGKGFSPKAENNSVSFNGTTAQISSADKKELQVTVPEDATSGAVSVTVGKKTISGPNFTVKAEAPGISSVSPDSGAVGTEIIITGNNFSTTASENTITFNGTSATVKSASETELVTEVPNGASDGSIELAVGGQSTSGPEFDVITYGALEVSVITAGDSKDEDGYNLTVNTETRESDPTDTVYFNFIEQGSHTVELNGLAKNCSVEGENQQAFDITAGDTTSIEMQVGCQLALKNQIVFASDRSGNVELHVMDADGTNPQQLTNSTNSDAYPSVSPDGTQIVYSELSETDNKGTLYVIDVDGTNRQKLTTPASGASDISPKWSPDGTKIVFTRDYGADGNYDRSIFVINPDGTGLAAVLDEHDISEAWASWSPDSQKIVFTSDETGNGDLFIINSDGTAKEQLTNQTEFDGQASWSPDGSKIVYASSISGGGTHIFTIGIDGKEVTQITKSSQDMNHFPEWSPDGSELIFGSDRNGNMEIYKKNADGTGLTVNLTANSAGDTTPTWSPVQ